MNARERFLAVMRFEPGVRTLLWEFGYWTATVERWYGEGLPRSPFSPPPGFPAGSGVFGDALPFPHMPSLVRYRDIDVHTLLGFDDGTVRIPLNWRLSPPFKEVILEEDETTQVMINADGVMVRASKNSDTIPQYLAWPVQDRTTWEKIKEERFSLQIQARFPQRWEAVAPSYGQRDFPLGLVMDGFFSTPRELLGVENQLMMYYDDPGLMHDINEHLVGIWLSLIEEVVAKVDLDFVYVWEDMAFKNGPLISPHLFNEFIVPYYRRLTGALKAHGIDIIVVDTDGDCWKLLPGFVEGGVTGLYPFEVQAGMDVVQVRKQYPQLTIQGGLDKTKVARGRSAIDFELESKLPYMLKKGGYIPYCDHLVPPDVPWENFRYYRMKVQQNVERYQSP
jgi:uroporphyrinogen decarboxylase